MDSVIETSKLGPVKISRHVTAYFSNQSEHGDPAKSAEEVVRVLQSQQIEKLEVPASIAQRMVESEGGPSTIEFWVHPGSSMVFVTLPKDGYKLVHSAIKQSMDRFVFDDS